MPPRQTLSAQRQARSQVRTAEGKGHTTQGWRLYAKERRAPGQTRAPSCPEPAAARNSFRSARLRAHKLAHAPRPHACVACTASSITRVCSNHAVGAGQRAPPAALTVRQLRGARRHICAFDRNGSKKKGKEKNNFPGHGALQEPLLCGGDHLGRSAKGAMHAASARYYARGAPEGAAGAPSEAFSKPCSPCFSMAKLWPPPCLRYRGPLSERYATMDCQESVSRNFGDVGAGSLFSGMTVKYYNPIAAIFIASKTLPA